MATLLPTCCGAGLRVWLSSARGGSRRDANSAQKRSSVPYKSVSELSLTSTTASGSDFAFSPTAASSPGGSSLSEFTLIDSFGAGTLDLFGLVDATQLLSYCSPKSIVTLRSTGRSVYGGHLDAGEMRNVLRHYLAALRRSSMIRSLHDAAEEGDLEAMWTFLFMEGEARAHDLDEYGMALLHYAAHKGHVGVCKLLMRLKVDVNVRHTGLNIRNSWSPLHFAACGGRRDVLFLLLHHGASVNQLDSGRRTPLVYAESSNKAVCSRILRKYGGVEDTHLVDDQHLRESLYFNEGQRLGRTSEAPAASRSAYVEHQWDASADAADMFAEGSRAPPQFPEGSLADQERLFRYIGPAGDSGPNLTHGAAVMPGFEW